MPRLPIHDSLVAGLLLCAAVRTGCATLGAPPRDLLDPASGPPTLLPDLAHDGWLRLSWLPGIGAERARSLVAQRPYLGFPLTPGRLALLPGFGPATAEAVEAFYAGAVRGPPGPSIRP